mmetsp:Transcript_155/g.416  ORF Transcript_155/g.416 Transcript_155/m.416 type:complete len:226 (-) Transcript_155:923-1600(-)
MPRLKRTDEDNSFRTPSRAPTLGTVTGRPRRLCPILLGALVGISAASWVDNEPVPGPRFPLLLRQGCLGSLVQSSLPRSPAMRLLKIPLVVWLKVRLLSCLVGLLLFFTLLLSCGIRRSAWDALFVMLPRLLDALVGGCLGETLPFASCSSHFFTSSIAAAVTETPPCESMPSAAARFFFPFDRRRATLDASFARLPRLRAVALGFDPASTLSEPSSDNTSFSSK